MEETEKNTEGEFGIGDMFLCLFVASELSFILPITIPIIFVIGIVCNLVNRKTALAVALSIYNKIVLLLFVVVAMGFGVCILNWPKY